MRLHSGWHVADEEFLQAAELKFLHGGEPVLVHRFSQRNTVAG